MTSQRGLQPRIILTAANGGWDYMPWLLNQIHQHDQSTGYRLLDYFTAPLLSAGGQCQRQ